VRGDGSHAGQAGPARDDGAHGVTREPASVLGDEQRPVVRLAAHYVPTTFDVVQQGGARVPVERGQPILGALALADDQGAIVGQERRSAAGRPPRTAVARCGATGARAPGPAGQ